MKSSPSRAANVAATCPCVTSAMSARSPRGGVSGPMTAIQMYAEEELEQRMCRFFHASIYHVVRGYETALRLDSRLAS